MSYLIQKYSIKVQAGEGALKETRSVVKKGKPVIFESREEMMAALYALKNKTKRTDSNKNANLPIAKALIKDDEGEIVCGELTYRHDNLYPVLKEKYSIV